MLGRWLRRVLLGQGLFLLGLWTVLIAGHRIGGAAAAGICVAAFIALNSIVPMVTGILAAVYSRRLEAGLRPDRRRLRRAGHADWLAFFGLFVFIQPFARWWMGDDRAPGRGVTPVLLVHGYVCNSGLWWWLARELRRKGVSVATVDLDPPLAGIDRLAESLAARIDALAAQTTSGRIVLVAHSMGGLVARAYLRRHGPDRVAQLITIGTPHRGTALAWLGLGRNAHEMRPGGEWIARLNQSGPPPVPTVNIWSTTDNFILPQDRARMPGVREHIVSGLGHLSMVFSPRVLRYVLEALGEADVRSESRAEAG